ncbi:MAG TPA: AAA family ATPase, partial [Chroococcales cyanobacterium]
GQILAEKEKNQVALLEAAFSFAASSEKLKPFEGLDERLGEIALLRERHKEAFMKQLGLLPLSANLVKRSEEKASSERDFLEASEQHDLAQKRLLECRQKYQRDPHLAAQMVLEDLKARQVKLDMQVKYFQGQIEEKEEAIALLEKIKASLEEVWEEKARWEDTHSFLEFARQTLKEAGPRITETYLMNVSLRANQLFRSILESEGDLNWGRDYEITLSENGQLRPFNNLSGGEQMAAALAVRLALIKEVSDLDVAFFDEPTTNLDGERRKNLARQIGQIRDFSQLFVISHDDTFEESTDHVVKLSN